MRRPLPSTQIARPTLGWWALAVLLAAGPAAAAGPRAVVPEPIKDVGVVAKGDKVVHAFSIRNDGDAKLRLDEVKPACGCTVAAYDKVIEPGASGQVRAELSTAEFRGPIAKSVVVYTNDPENPRINLVIKADIKPLVEVRPGYARFIVVRGEGYEPSDQLVWSEEAPDLEVLEVESPYEFVRAESHRLTAGDEGYVEGGNRWRVRISLTAEAPIGPLADFVRVHTSHPTQKVIKVPVSGYVRPILAVTPQVADFGRRALTEPYQATLEVKNLSSSAVRLGAAAVDLEGVAAAIEAVEEGKLYNLVLTLSPAMQKGRFRGKVTVQTSSRLQPLLEIDVTGTVL